MDRRIERVAVLGAGSMGAAIAAHLANAGFLVRLFDLGGLAAQTLARLPSAQPPALFTPGLAGRISPGDIEADLHHLGDADWIVEAVVEDPAVKVPLLRRVDALRRPGSIVSTNTSGIPVNLLAQGLSDDLRRHWLGTHFFNPPRYLKLVEIIPGQETDPAVIAAMREILDRRLGKGVVIARDTPNFIGNRIGVYSIMVTLHAMLRHGWSVAEVDALTGPVMARARSATFRTLDLVGIDVLCHVLRHTHASLVQDEEREIYLVPDLLKTMVERGWLGAKSGTGFYRKVKGGGGSRILALDWQRMEHVEAGDPLPELAELRGIAEPGERLRRLAAKRDRTGRFASEILDGVLLYAARRLPEIAGGLEEIDRAMCWGFGWQLGPFESWDALGVKRTATHLAKQGRAIPPVVEELLRSGKRSFYARRAGSTRVFDAGSGRMRPIAQPPGLLRLEDVREAGRVVEPGAAASLLDLGDGAACLDLHARLNTIGRDTLGLMERIFELMESRGFAGLLVTGEGENFCVGANLKELLVAAREKNWDEIDAMVRSFQRFHLGLRFAPWPVVVAPYGLTLGGGCEIALSGARVHASAETYMGLVEVGVGVIPAGGGTKEMLRRHVERLPEELRGAGGTAWATGGSGDLFALVELAFRTIGQARVSTSAPDARRLLYLAEADPHSMNADRLAADALETLRGLMRSGYRPPLPRTDLPALGESAFARLRLTLHMLERAGQISSHDRLVGEHLARVLCGGTHAIPRAASEQQFLDLEREAFLSLVAEPKTQERMEHTLREGRPLRN